MSIISFQHDEGVVVKLMPARRSIGLIAWLMWRSCALPPAVADGESKAKVDSIGHQTQLFLDHHIIESLADITAQLNQPVKYTGSRT